MKLSLRFFLILSLLVGALFLPATYRYVQARREAEIAKLEREYADLWARSYAGDLATMDRLVEADGRRIAEIESRLKKLTGRMPARPEPKLEANMGEWNDYRTW